MSNTVDPTFDTPDNEDVLQADETPLEAIPVSIDNVVRTEEMPSRRCTFRSVVLRAGTDAQKVAQDNPRRKRLLMWPIIALDSELVYVCVADTFAESQAFAGALMMSGPNAIARYELTYSGEVFARPCLVVDTGGTFEDITVSTDDILLCVVEEEWAT